MALQASQGLGSQLRPTFLDGMAVLVGLHGSKPWPWVTPTGLNVGVEHLAAPVLVRDADDDLVQLIPPSWC